MLLFCLSPMILHRKMSATFYQQRFYVECVDDINKTVESTQYTNSRFENN